MADLDATMAHAIIVLIQQVETKVGYVRGSEVDGAVRFLKSELRRYEESFADEVSNA